MNRLLKKLIMAGIATTIITQMPLGTLPGRFVYRILYDYKNEYKVDVNDDGLEDLIITNDEGAGLKYHNTGLPFPKYILMGWTRNYKLPEEETLTPSSTLE